MKIGIFCIFHSIVRISIYLYDIVWNTHLVIRTNTHIHTPIDKWIYWDIVKILEEDALCQPWAREPASSTCREERSPESLTTLTMTLMTTPPRGAMNPLPVNDTGKPLRVYWSLLENFEWTSLRSLDNCTYTNCTVFFVMKIKS